MTIGKFIIHYIAYTCLLALGAFTLQLIMNPVSILSPNFWLLFIYLFILTAIVYLLSYYGAKRSPETGVFAILGGIIMKFLFSLALFVVILLKTSENQVVLGLNFFSIYLLFTVFEVIYLLRNLRHQN